MPAPTHELGRLGRPCHLGEARTITGASCLRPIHTPTQPVYLRPHDLHVSTELESYPSLLCRYLVTKLQIVILQNYVTPALSTLRNHLARKITDSDANGLNSLNRSDAVWNRTHRMKQNDWRLEASGMPSSPLHASPKWQHSDAQSGSIETLLTDDLTQHELAAGTSEQACPLPLQPYRRSR